MLPTARHDLDELPSWVRRNWLVPLAIGLLSTAFGVVLLVNIRSDLSTARWLVVAALILAGVDAFATAPRRRRPWIGWLAGALYLAGAVACAVWPDATARVLAVVLGVSLIAAGGVQVGTVLRTPGRSRLWGTILGGLAVVAGAVLLLGSPLLSVLLLMVILGCYLVSVGLAMLTVALTVRRAHSTRA